MNKLIKYFIDKPLFVNLLTFFVLITGLISLNQIKKEGYPAVDRKMLRVTTTYPGASPEDVELNVTIPLEKAIKSVDGIEKFTSQSYENYSKILIHLDRNFKDSEKIKTDIRRAVDNVPNLPEEVKNKPDIWEWKTSNFTIIRIGIYSGTLSEKQVRTRSLDLKKKLESSPYVSQVESNGIRDREIQVKINLNKLNRYYISLEEVITAIRSHNIQITGGTIDSYLSEKTIVTLSKFKNILDVKNVIIRSSYEGHKVTLNDIAEIEDTFEETHTKIRFNGKDGMALNIKKKQSADIIKAVDHIKKSLNEYKKSLKDEDINFVVLWDQSEETRTRLGIVQNNAIIGLILVIISLFIFLNFKNALWTAIGIPFSITFAIIFFPVFNITINSVSLLGIIVVLGMIVDDAIIVSENIFRHRIEGKSDLEAGIIGTREVANPVLSTVLTTVAAFTPILFIHGIIGDFSKEIPVVISLILLGSLIESLLILPNHITHSFSKKEKTKIIEKKFITKLKLKYKTFLKIVLKHRYITILIFAIAAGLTFYGLFFQMKFEMFPDIDAKFFNIHGKIKKVKSLSYTYDKLKEIEKFVLKKFDSKIMNSLVSHIGSKGYPENFNLLFYLKPDSSRDITSDEIIKTVKDEIDRIDIFTNIYIEKDTGGPPVGRPLVIDVIGSDNDRRKKLSDYIEKYLRTKKGVYDIQRTDDDIKDEIKIYPDYVKLARLGVTALNIAQIIKIAYEGLIVTDIQTPDELINYRVMLSDIYRKKLSTLKKLNTQNNQLRLVPILQMVNMEETKAPTVIRHYKGDRTTTISADVNSKIITPKEIYYKIKNDFKNFEIENPGFRMILGGEAKESMESLTSLRNAIIIAIFFIALILILLFRSFTQPIMVLLAIPFGFIGVYIAFQLHGMVLGVMALLGVTGLSGVVVNDSLVMVEYINILKKNDPKKPINEIVLKGAVTRLRPILLTTITTVVGLFPTTYGIGGKDFMLIPATMALSWGLVFATTLTLFLIPCLYLIEIDTRKLFNNIFIWGKNKIIRK